MKNFPFTQYKPWMIERYGEALFRIPVQLASTCPHGRCVFCAENGSRARQTQRQESPLEQVDEAIRFACRRYRANQFMLYIQAFTADLTDPAQQDAIFHCLEKHDFSAISIGTRPDCLPPEAIDFLETLQTSYRPGVSTRREVWVELGVQTTNDETLEKINRGHDWACSKQAIQTLAEHGIHVAAHVILGLPGETSTDWKNTAEELAHRPLSGIKIHNLHVMKGTKLADHPPPTLNHWEYAEGLMDFLRRIPANIPVMRISTDTPEDQLMAPHWPLEKGQFLKYVIQQMTCRQIAQGDRTKSRILNFESRISPITTADGSVTFFSEDWKEHYHTKAGARLEAEQKFVVPSDLREKIKTTDIRLLDVCFGLGNNSLAALCAAQRADKSVCSTRAADTPICHSLDITALEIDKRIVRAAAEHFQPLGSDPMDWTEALQNLLEGPVELPPPGHTVRPTRCDGSVAAKIDLRFGDARWLIQHIKNNEFDVVFHDPFSSQHCPELWTVDFFKQLYRVLRPTGVLLTYSLAAPIRGALREAGLWIAETIPGHRMGNGTIASPTKPPDIFPSIGKPDERRAIPYRDPHLCATSKAILRQRQEAVEAFPG